MSDSPDGYDQFKLKTKIDSLEKNISKLTEQLHQSELNSSSDTLQNPLYQIQSKLTNNCLELIDTYRKYVDLIR